MTLHADALAVLRDWSAPTRTQGDLQARYVAHLEEHPDGVFRSCRPDHLTASCLVMSEDAGRVLLTLHAKAHRWFQFGGHLEDGDTSLHGAASREAAEESGIEGLWLLPSPVQLDEHAVPFCGGSGITRHLDVRYLAIAPPGAEPAISAESLDVRWWPAGELPNPELADLVALARRAR